MSGFEIPVERTPAAGWSLTAHACRHCGGRVLNQGIHFMCATCETRCTYLPSGVCGCGMLPGAAPNGQAGPFTCVANPAPGPSSPARIVVRYG